MYERDGYTVSCDELLETIAQPKKHQFCVDDLLVGHDAALLLSKAGPEVLVAAFQGDHSYRLAIQIARERGILTVNLRQLRPGKVFAVTKGSSTDRFGTLSTTVEHRYPSFIIGDHTVVKLTDDSGYLDGLRFCSFSVSSNRFIGSKILNRVLNAHVTQSNELSNLLNAQVLAHTSTS